MRLQTVGIVGGGAWGTALAVSARRAGRDALLWAFEPETVAEINEKHRNSLYLPGIEPIRPSWRRQVSKTSRTAIC